MDSAEEEDEIHTQEESKCLNEMVKAILILDHSKKPFKQSDIVSFLSKKPNRKIWNNLLTRAKEKLNELGLKLVETKNTSSKAFFLINNSFPLSIMHEYAPETEVADRTLLLLVLTYIFMREGSATNIELFSHLQQLNIYDEEKPVHEYFGDIKKKILMEFVSQLYLEKTADKESETFEIKWGERAHEEITKRSILEFVCKIGYEGTVKPENLANYYQKVLEEEKERGESGDGNGNGNEIEPMVVED